MKRTLPESSSYAYGEHVLVEQGMNGEQNWIGVVRDYDPQYDSYQVHCTNETRYNGAQVRRSFTRGGYSWVAASRMTSLDK